MFSIIIPFFNRSSLLIETLKSVQAQTMDAWECIVVDDGSSSDEADIITSYCGTDEKIKYYILPKNIPRGGNGSRNVGASLATYPYIIFLDSDDLFTNQAFDNRKRIIDEMAGYYFWIFRTGVFRNNIEDARIEENYPKTPENGVKQYFKYQMPWQVGAIVWDKYWFVNQLGGWDERLLCMQDFELSVRAICKYNNGWMVKENQVDFYYRLLSADSISSKYKTVDYFKNAKIALLIIESNITQTMKPYFEKYVVNFFIYKSLLYIGFIKTFALIIYTNDFQTISKTRLFKFLTIAVVERIKINMAKLIAKIKLNNKLSGNI